MFRRAGFQTSPVWKVKAYATLLREVRVWKPRTRPAWKAALPCFGILYESHSESLRSPLSRFVAAVARAAARAGRRLADRQGPPKQRELFGPAHAGVGRG